MKYDSWDDYLFFILGASVAAGRSVWVSGGESTKHLKAAVSADETVATLTMIEEAEHG